MSKPRDNPIITRLPNTRAWVRARFVFSHHLLTSDTAPEGYDGVDFMVLLAWVLRQLPEEHTEPFVLHYWDLRPPNILVDKDHNLAAYEYL
jgi:hypothetical protein